jgi:hypothetical protein
MNDLPTFLDALVKPAIEGCQHPRPQTLIRLWDGRDHCEGCVEEACPGLAGFARGRDTLEDSIVYDQAGGMRTWWKYTGLFFGVLALTSIGFVAVLDLKATLILTGLMALSLGFGALGTLTSVFKASQVLPTVRVHDGLVEVYRPNHGQSKSLVATFRLEDARWRSGKLQEDSSCRGRGGAIVTEQRVVILRSPQRWKGSAPPNEFTAVGSSPEMVRIWTGFLKLAGVPEGK